MLVYRAIQNINKYTINDRFENEYLEYLNKRICNPSKEHNHGENTHTYIPGIAYLHFFHYREDAYQYISNTPGAMFTSYISEYDIPDEILQKNVGVGLYPDHIKQIPVLEYAIPFELLDNKYITGKIIKYSYNSKCSDEYTDYINNHLDIIKKLGINCWWNKPIQKIKKGND